ncbi:MAG: hypothetical protein FWE88_01700 [Phycisphaerae bacterium]|nr:hypothetical protein [Phycisphaerae bacterium]
MAITQTEMRLLQRVLESPTVPFREEAVAAVVAEWAASHGVAIRRDRWGNVVLDWPGEKAVPCRGVGRRRSAGRTAWCLAAHMDHPGFVLRRMKDRTAWADFLGSVRQEYFVGGRVAFFGDGKRIGRGVVTKCWPAEEGKSEAKPAEFPRVEIALADAAALPVGAIGMWDFPAMRVRGETLSSRACDDLVGCAAVMCAMGRIVASRPAHRVLAVFARAEEVGFVGAMAACEAGTIPEGSLVISVETSKAQPAAALGDGAVVRVGDASRTFDPAVTAMMSTTAAALAKEDAEFRYSRQLMPGGTCEATAYQAWGLRTGGLCLPLANYHNMGPARRVASERINLRDFDAAVKLLTAVAQQPPDTSANEARLKQRLDALLARRRQWL